MRFELTEAAIEDLQSIRNYTLQQWGSEPEAIYLDALWDRLNAIAANPTRSRSREDLFSGCRVAAHGKHVILFCIQDSVLQVVRILHSAMDYSRHVSDED